MSRTMQLTVGIKGLKQGQNILELNVPAKLRERRKSGIEWFDDALGGEGLTPSTSMMLTGGPGCGKTTMLLQLADAFTRQGYIALLNTGEESLYQVRMVADRLKLKTGFICGQDIQLGDLLDHAINLQKQNKGKQVILLQDSLQTLDDGFYANGGTNSNTPVRCCELLTDWAKQTYGICIFIGQVNKGGEFAGKNQIKHAVDVHGHLFFDDARKSPTYGERLFEVQKNRFGCNGKTYVIGIDESGLYEKGNYEKVDLKRMRSEE